MLVYIMLVHVCMYWYMFAMAINKKHNRSLHSLSSKATLNNASLLASPVTGLPGSSDTCWLLWNQDSRPRATNNETVMTPRDMGMLYWNPLKPVWYCCYLSRKDERVITPFRVLWDPEIRFRVPTDDSCHVAFLPGVKMHKVLSIAAHYC